jgi:hypothetical protein
MLSEALPSSQASLIDNVKHRFHTSSMASELWQRIRAVRAHLSETQEV